MSRTIIILLVFLTGYATAQDNILVAAASDLKFALDSVLSQFKKNTGGRVEVTYGSSGKLTEQIQNGAPFDIFFSADVSYPTSLKEKGKASSDVYEYAKGHLVIWSTRIDPSKSQMRSLLDPLVKKIAIANPQHAPYGKRAVESLAYYKLTEAVKSKLVYGENISQTAQFVSTGAADVGIIALSIALSPNMKREKGAFYLIPEESHQPLAQGAIITAHGSGNKLAVSFFEYIKSEDAVRIFENFGLSRP